jgi:alpha-galactosidase
MTKRAGNLHRNSAWGLPGWTNAVKFGAATSAVKDRCIGRAPMIDDEISMAITRRVTMFSSRMIPAARVLQVALVIILAGASLLTQAHAARPTPDELTLRDRWVKEHFPAAQPPAPAAVDSAGLPEGGLPEAGLMAWTSLGPVFCNQLPNLPMQIADRKFDHALFCHAPGRVRVRLPGPARSFSAVVGILTNPASQGGSIVFSVDVGGTRLFSSAVMHRGEAGAPVNVELNGARDFIISVGCAGDGLSSDQGVWGDARVALADGKELFISDLPLRDPLTAGRSAETPPFSFWYGDQHSDRLLPGWKLQEEREASNARKTTRVRTYTDPKTGLAVRNTVVEYADFPTVEWTLSFKNTGTGATPILEGILPLDTRFERDASGEFLLHHFIGSPCQANDYEPLETKLEAKAAQRIATDGGRPTNTHLPYFNIETGKDGGVIAVIGWAGQWAAQFTRDEGTGLRVTGGQEATSFRLHPGEEVRGPLVVLQFYRGDWIRSQNVWRSWMLEHNVPRHDGKVLSPFIYACTGNCYPGLKTDAATELQFFEGYAKEGILPDYWNQDAGWYPCGDGWWNVGNWEVDKTRWPNGLREASDWLHAHGVKRITWFEPERLARGTWLAQHHPEWCFGGAGGGLMKIGDPDFRAWITDRIDRLITSEGIDFYRQDFNIDPLYSWRGSDAEDRQGISEIRHIEGYFAFWDELARRHPNVWIDSCASGGRRNDLETLRRAVPILRSDFAGNPADPGYDPLSQQNHVYGISFWMPYHGSGIEHVDPYWTRSLMGPIVGFGVDTRKKDWNYDLLRKLYKQVRQVQRCYLGDYYPLTPYRKDSGAWAAYQFDLPDAGEGIVHAFRRKTCPDRAIMLKLRGLQPETRYLVQDIDGGEPRAALGRDLLEDGLEVTAADPQTALIFTYHPQR